MPSSTTSDYLFDRQVASVLRQEVYTPPTALYVGLFTTKPALTGTGGVEVVSNANTNYARVTIPSNSSNWSEPSGINRQFSNLNDVVFGVPGTQSWGTITGMGLFDAATGGNLLWVGDIGTSRPVSSGDGAPRILQGQMKISRSVC